MITQDRFANAVEAEGLSVPRNPVFDCQVVVLPPQMTAPI
jgi:hypothetical protein